MTSDRPVQPAAPGPSQQPGQPTDAADALVPDLLMQRLVGDPRAQGRILWDDFCSNRLAFAAMWVMILFIFVGVFAPFIANHRPFVLYEGGEGGAGLSFPLFRFLRLSDWVLMPGLINLVAALLIYRIALHRERILPPLGVGVGSLLTAIPPIMALINGHLGGIGEQPMWWIGVVGVSTGLGGWLVIVALSRLLSQERDSFGQLHTGGHIVRWLFGATLLLIASAMVGTLGQPRIDPMDYTRLLDRDDVWGVRAPIRQDYLGSQSFARYQSPGAPFTRVQRAGGSDAAFDLGLTDGRRGQSIAHELPHAVILAQAQAAGVNIDDPEALRAFQPQITRDTPLSSLRRGEGVRSHGLRQTDMTVISHSLHRYPVTLYGLETIGDVLDAIERAAGGALAATIADDGSHIVLRDANPPRPKHYLGTDRDGSDVAARLIHATRVALSIGFVSTGIAVFVGVTLGALMGYFGGWIDIAGMRLIEIVMAIPNLFLILTIIAFIPPEWNDYMLYAMMAVIGLTGWTGAARFIRAEFFKLRDQDFVQAAKATGIPLHSILFRHMLPNGVTPVLVDASFSIAAAILLETGLSFLGFGIKPPNPSWGQMLSDAVDTRTGVFYWWLAIFPGLMIFLTVFSFNLIGDALRDAIDPRLKKASAI